MNKIETTKQEREILSHTLGIDEYHKSSYRNYFFAGKNHTDLPILEALIKKGLMATRRNPLSSDTIYFVTKKGKEEVQK